VSLFRVWAPGARELAVMVHGRSLALERGEGGWWSAEVAETRPGDDYAFRVDGEGPFPDPRSAWQPQGVHGPSRLVDHAAFRWSDGGWRAGPLEAAVLYEAHAGTFSPLGTFASAIPYLDHLVALGITHLELMPVAAFPGRHGWGYDGVALFAPHEPYGGPQGLKQLVDACHARGLAVILDVVYNHLGPSGNYLGRFGPYFTSRYQTPWGPALNLDGPDSDEVRRYLCDNAVQWLRDYHLDGLRLDAVHALADASAEPFLEQLAREVDELEAALERPLVLIAESDLNDPRLVRPREAGGFGLHAQWSDDFHHALHAWLTGEREGYYADFGRLADVARALEHAYVLTGGYSRHRRRRHGRPACGLSGHRFLAYAQNHDQVGNRPAGDRLGAVLSEGQLRIAAALVFTSPFLPLLFQGEEWGARTPFPYFTDHDDPELARAVGAGRRREFAALGRSEVPDPQDPETYRSARLDWSEPERPPHAGLLQWHQRLIALRRRVPELRDGRRDRLGLQFDEGGRWLRFERGPLTVAVNAAPEPRRVPLPRPHARVALAAPAPLSWDAGSVTLAADAVAILER